MKNIPPPDDDPDGQKDLDRHRAFLELVYRGLEAGVESTRAHFTTFKLTYSGTAFSSLVRCHLHEHIERNKHLHPELKVLRLANDGVLIEHAGCVMRMWKAGEDGTLPPARSSQTKAEHYRQVELFAYGTPGVSPRKLVILFELDEQHALSEVWLVCPRNDVDSWNPPDIHWQIRVPHPAESIQPAQGFGADERDDQEPMTGTGSNDS